jgi:hypothetical protein
MNARMSGIDNDRAPVTVPSEVVIDRDRWARGPARDGVNHLYDFDTNCYCALGFLLRAAGVPDAEMDGRSHPDDCRLAEWPDALIGLLAKPIASDGMTQTWTHEVMLCNDQTPPAEVAAAAEIVRERELRELFAAQGITLTFIN